MNIKRYLTISLVSMGLVSCTTAQYSKPSQVRFNEIKSERSQVINVIRDDKLCDNETTKEQVCPTQFYIDDIKAGTLYVNNSTQYYLKPETYNFKVKNCTGECTVCATDVNLADIKNHKIIFTVDNQGFPLMLNADQKPICEISSSQNKPTTLDLKATPISTSAK